MDGEDTLGQINNSHILGAKLTFIAPNAQTPTLRNHEYAITLVIMVYPQKRSIIKLKT